MQRIVGVCRLRMRGADVVAAEHDETGFVDPLQQGVARPQPEMLGEIGQDQPALAARLQMRGQPREETAQHAAVRVVDRVFDRRARPGRHPWRVADHERRTAGRKQVGLDDLDLARMAEPRDVLARAGERARILVGRDDALDAARHEHRRQHAGARADIERERRRRQRRARDELDVFAAHRREHAVVRMDRRAAERRDRHALLAPLVRADEAEQFAQRHDRRHTAGAVRLLAGRPHVGRAAQRDRVIGVQRDQQHAERAGALRLRETMQVERIDAGRGFRLLRFAFDTARHRLQELARILEVALPDERGALASETVGRIGREAVVGGHRALRRLHAGFGTPAHGMIDAVGVGPVEKGEIGHANSVRLASTAARIHRADHTIPRFARPGKTGAATAARRHPRGATVNQPRS